MDYSIVSNAPALRVPITGGTREYSREHPVNHATIDDVVYARDNNIAFVPEPSTWLLTGSGIALLLPGARRRD